MSPAPLPTQLFRITPGPVVHATEGVMDPAHLCEEVSYLTDFAGKMAECLGANTFEVGYVEDAASQTAFYRIPLRGPGLEAALVNGVVNSARKKLVSTVLQELWEE